MDENWRIVSKPGKVGIRNKGGYICFMNFPDRYPGQVQRHIKEVQDMMKAARLMESAPQLLEELMGLLMMDEIKNVLSEEDGFRIGSLIKRILK